MSGTGYVDQRTGLGECVLPVPCPRIRLDALEDRHWWYGDLPSCEIERHREERSRACVHKMAGTRIARIATSVNEGAPLPRLERLKHDLSIVKSPEIVCLEREDEELAARQKLGKTMATLPLLRIGGGEDLGCASGRWDARDSSANPRSEDDAVRAPACTTLIGRVEQGNGRPTSRRHGFELPITVTEERDPFSVWREERKVCALGTRNWGGFEAVQRTQVQLLSTVSESAHVGQALTVGGYRHRGSCFYKECLRRAW